MVPTCVAPAVGGHLAGYRVWIDHGAGVTVIWVAEPPGRFEPVWRGREDACGRKTEHAGAGLNCTQRPKAGLSNDEDCLGRQRLACGHELCPERLECGQEFVTGQDRQFPLGFQCQAARVGIDPAGPIVVGGQPASLQLRRDDQAFRTGCRAQLHRHSQRLD